MSKSYPTKEIKADSNTLFPLNQRKGNYWSVMREYVKRFELLEGLDKLCHKNASIVEIKEYLKNFFTEWAGEKTSKGKVPKFHDKILNIRISDYIDTLRSITYAENGFYKILFDFNGLKDQISLLGKPMCYFKNAFSAGFLNSYRVTKHWEGTLFRIPEKEMGGEKYHRSADTFIFYLRSGVFQYREIMEQSIVNKLKECHFTSLGNNFEKAYNFRIKEIWSKYHLAPQDIKRNAIIEGTEKQKIFERSKIHFHLLDAKILLLSLFDEFNNLHPEYPDFNMRFRKVFCNSNITKRSQKLVPIAKTIIQEKPLRYLDQSTLKDLREPILWMGNQLRFASPTNESIKSGAIRFFLDIVLNSPEGRKILIDAGMIDPEENSLLISDWSTGLGTSTAQQASGLLDAVIRTKSKKNISIVKFGVEIIGSDKAKQGPLTSLKNTDELRHSVIGDFLRIACNSAGGIPGIVVAISNNHNGDLVYTLFKYDTDVREALQKFGAAFAIDLNREKVRRILQRHEDVLDILRETYGDSNIAISKNILKILPKYNSLGYVYRFYFDIILKIIEEK